MDTLLSSRLPLEGGEKDSTMPSVIALLASRALLWLFKEYPTCINGQMRNLLQSYVTKVVEPKGVRKTTAACSLELLSTLHILSLSLNSYSSKGIGNENKNEESHVEEVVESIFALFRCHPTSVPVLAALHSALSALTPRTPAISGEPAPRSCAI